MDISEILKTYCFGCTGGFPRLKFVRPEGDRYVHMAGSINPERVQLTLDIVCTAAPAFFTKEIDDMSFEACMKKIGKEQQVQFLPVSDDKDSIEVKPRFFEEYVNGTHETAVSLPSGPQRP